MPMILHFYLNNQLIYSLNAFIPIKEISTWEVKMSNPGEPGTEEYDQAMNDNHADQLNPNNDEYGGGSHK